MRAKILSLRLLGLGVAVISATSIFLGLAAGGARAHDGHHHGGGQPKACESPELDCASKVTALFADEGTLWIAWAAGGYVSVAKSSDLGKSFSARKSVNTAPANIDWGPDARPKIAVSGRNVFVTYTVFKDKAFNGQVFYSVSRDGGESFSEPAPITADNESQRFEALAIGKDGRLFLAWIDKRNRAAAREKGEKYVGAALAFAWADNSGVGNASIADASSCECCRVGIALRDGNIPVVAYRKIFDGGIRDHAIITFAPSVRELEPKRVSVDNWKTDACPHQGPSLAISQSGKYHVVWYTAGEDRRGLFYASSDDAGDHFSMPLPLGDPNNAPSRPAVFASGASVFLAWKEFDGDRTKILVRTSRDDGRSWSEPREVAQTGGDSDHPAIIGGGRGVFLSWMTNKDGYRLIALEAGS